MEAAPPQARGLALILEHCIRLNCIDEVGPTAVVRLRQAIGDELARLLLTALAGEHHARPSAV